MRKQTCAEPEESDETDDSEQVESLVSKRGRFEVDSDSSTQIPSSQHQTNYITVENPTGPTTIVVTGSSSSPLPVFSQSTAQFSLENQSEPPDDIAPTPVFSPVQPTNLKFPVTFFSNMPRSFNPTWFKSYSWLEYSVKQDACFCYPCRLFGSRGGGPSSRPDQAFTTTGFKDWKHATGKSGILVCHDNCHAHKQAVIAWNQYTLNSRMGTSISERLGSARTEQVKQNRHYLKTVTEILLLCSHQEIALRGHRESEVSTNRGNFLEILKLVANHDQVIN